MSDNRTKEPGYQEENTDAQMYSSIDVSILRRSLKTIMKPAITVSIDTPINECILLMQKKRIGCVLVTSHGKLLGIFTERDVLKKILGTSFDLDQTPITEVMTTSPQVLNEIDTIAYALNFMDLGGYRHIPIVNNVFEPVGVVSVKDIVAYFVEHFADEVLNLPPHPYTVDNPVDDDDNADSDTIDPKAQEDAERED